jgi:hypothetical protein
LEPVELHQGGLGEHGIRPVNDSIIHTLNRVPGPDRSNQFHLRVSFAVCRQIDRRVYRPVAAVTSTSHHKERTDWITTRWNGLPSFTGMLKQGSKRAMSSCLWSTIPKPNKKVS